MPTVDPVPRGTPVLTVSTGPSTTLVAGMPAGITAGDLLIAIYLQRGSTAACTMSGGFTTRIGSHASGTQRSCDVFGKIAAGGDTMTVTKPSTDTAAVIVFAWQAGTFDTVQWTEGFVTSMALASDSTPPLPEVTTTIDRAMAISAALIRSASTSGSGLTKPTGWTQAGIGFADNDTDGGAVGGCYKLITPAGAMGSFDWSGGPANSGPMVSFVVRPGGGSSPPSTTAEVRAWDHTLNGGLGGYSGLAVVTDWRPASSDYLPTSGADDVMTWKSTFGDYFPGGDVDETPPTQPGAISASSITQTTITFTWGASVDDVGVTGYRIRINGGAWVSEPTLSHQFTGLTSSTAYTPEVQAQDAAGNWSITRTGSAVTTSAAADVTPPTQPGQPTATPTGGTVALSWTASTDAVGVVGYDVHRSAVSGFTPDAGTLKLQTATNSGSETNVPTGTWFYKVIARDAAGNSSTPSTQRSVTVSSPVSPMLMGFNDDHTANDGGNIAPGWRTYTRGALKARANQTGTATPLFHAYSPSAQVTGSYSAVKAATLQLAEDFYYGNAAMDVGSGAGSSTRSVRWGQKLYHSCGNENYENGKALDMTVDAYTDVMRGQWDAIMTELSPGVRKFPDMFSTSNPTQNQEKSGTVAAYLQPTAQYHHNVMWSTYPPGRQQTVTNPTFNWPTLTRAELDSSVSGVNANNLQAGHIGRCVQRTWLAREQARADTGDPTFDITFGVGETGIPSDPGDATTRPYFIVMGMAGATFIICDEYDITAAFACYWSNKAVKNGVDGPHNILSDEGPASDHGNTGTPNPTSEYAWVHWFELDTRRGGTRPASWAGNPKPGWKHTGTQV